MGLGLTPLQPEVRTWGDNGSPVASGLHGPQVFRGSQPPYALRHGVEAADGHCCLPPQWVLAERLWQFGPQLEQAGV